MAPPAGAGLSAAGGAAPFGVSPPPVLPFVPRGGICGAESCSAPPQIPLLRRAIAMAKRPLSIYGSPWTAPAWMKSNGDIRGKGTLKGRAGGKYHRAWANYFVRYRPRGGKGGQRRG